jgi:tRNA(His) guanylyltransferase
MKLLDFDRLMRNFECASMTVPFRNWIVLHVDGDNFHKWTAEQKLERPFDVRLRDTFDEIAAHIMSNMEGVFAMHQSDEISVLIPCWSNYLKREVPKLISKSVALASSRMTMLSYVETMFATHIYALPTIESVLDYYRWRFEDALRNSLNMCVYWALRDIDGLSGNQAAGMMHQKSILWKNEYLFRNGINFSKVDGWAKRGRILYWAYEKMDAVNRATGEPTEVERRNLVIGVPICVRENYIGFLREYVNDCIERHWSIDNLKE